MKSVDELKAEEAWVWAVLDAGAEAQLRAIPGVVHVSVGLKQINGTATDEFCIRVYVAQKQNPASIAASERIPKRIQGVATDVNQVQVIDLHEDTARYRPVTGGIQITNGVDGLGTLGCPAIDNADGKAVLFTNFHVIGGTAGVSVFQPTTAAADLIGTVKRGSIGATFDAAIAEIAAGVATTGDVINGLFLNLSNKIAGVTDPVSGMRVFKVGFRTGLTDGKVEKTRSHIFHQTLWARLLAIAIEEANEHHADGATVVTCKWGTSVSVCPCHDWRRCGTRG